MAALPVRAGITPFKAVAFPICLRLMCRQNGRRNTMNDGAPIRPARNVELGASGEEFQNLHEFVRKARARLNQNAWDYIVGASETETTMRRNRMSLDEIAFRPRVLRNVARSILPPSCLAVNCGCR